MTIDEALREAAARTGWSPTKIAAEVDATEQSARAWLKGRKTPTGDTLMKLRRAIPGFADLLDGKAVA
jgi:ribosome-binding protein aMBF1 (putative translation factor)